MARGCFYAVVVVVIAFMVLAAVGVLSNALEPSLGLIVYLLFLLILVGGLWYMVKAGILGSDDDAER